MNLCQTTASQVHSRAIHSPLPLHHRCCDYAQHDGVCRATLSLITHALPPSFRAPPVIPAVSAEPKLPGVTAEPKLSGVSAEPKLRHSARSRGIHGPLPPHHRCCDYAQHDGVCRATLSPITHALPPSFPAPAVIPAVSAEPKLPGVTAEPKLPGVTAEPKLSGVTAEPKLSGVTAEPKLPEVTAEPKLRHSARSRGIHDPLPLHHRCCDYAQHDGVCRATLSLISHALPPSFPAPPVIPAVSAEPKLPGVTAEPKLSGVTAEPKLPGVTAEPKLRHSARSRGIHDPLPLHHRCCDYAQHDGVCRATPSLITHALPPSFRAPPVIPAVSAEPKLPGVTAEPKLPGVSAEPKLPGVTAEPKLPGVTAEPKLRHSARSRGIHDPLPPHHRCCDYAQHDGVCSATPSPITHALPPSFPAPPVIPAVSAEPKLRHSARSRGIHDPLPLHHRCCDYAQHDGVCRATPSPITHALLPSFPAPPVIPAVSAEPKLRHSARSRGIHDPLPLHHRCCDYAQHDDACRATPSPITHALPPSFPAPPVIPAVSAEPKLPGVTAEPKLRHSARSRGIHDPLPLHHRCCDYAQHDGVCSATPSPITHALPPSFRAPPVIPAVTAEPKLPAVTAEPKLPGVTAEPKLPEVTAEPKLRHSARSRGIHDPLPLHHRCCDYAQHDGVCRATLSLISHALPPSFRAPPVIPAVSAEPKLPGVSAEPKLRHSARSRGIHDPLPPQHGCCDYAQHDGVCRATLSLISHALPPSLRNQPRNLCRIRSLCKK